MTAARRPRSAALLVGSTSGTSAKVQSAGQSFKRFFASARTCRCRLPVEPHSSSGRICALIAATRCRSAARCPTKVPASLVDVERARAPGLLEQLLVDRLERFPGASEDRVDRPDRDRAAKQLVQQLDQLPTRETIPDRERRNRRLQLRTETAARNARLQLGSDRPTAVGTAEPLQPVLADLDRKRRQLRHLVPCRRTIRLALGIIEDVAAAAALWPVVDDVRDPFDWEQRASVAGMARLCALLPPRPPRPAPLPQPGRIVARRQRRVARLALQPLLELLDP